MTEISGCSMTSSEDQNKELVDRQIRVQAFQLAAQSLGGHLIPPEITTTNFLIREAKKIEAYLKG